MPFQTSGAQRASSTSRLRLFVLPVLALALAAGSAAFQPQATAAASRVKVVIVVGPVEGQTSKYISNARSYAATARVLGASVTEIYSPNATWSRVRSAASGANIFIYLGHGNGYPSPYGAFRATTRDGLGLNSSAGHGNYNLKYYGETYVKAYLKFDKNAVVLLNHLCYAAGNSEPGRALPSKSVASTRVDYFGGGFIRAGARAVFANGKDSLDLDHPPAADDQPHHRADLPGGPGLLGSRGLPLRLEADPRLHGLAGSVRDRPLLPLGGGAAHGDRLGRPRRELTPATNGGPGPDRRPAGAEDSWCDSPGCSPGEGACRLVPAGGAA